MRRLALVCVVALVLAGCAPKRIVRAAAPATPRVDVDALLRRGCFHCFERALSAAQAAGDAQRAFEAAALVVLRAKELGLPVDERIRAMQRLLPPEPGWSELLEVITAVPSDELAGERYTRPFMDDFARRRRARDLVESWRATPDAVPGSALFRAYVSLAATCAIERGETAGATATKTLGEWADAPAIQFLAATCTRNAALLASVRAADADFMDTEYPLGRIALEGRVPDYDESLRHLQAAQEAFPDSIAIATALGNLRIQREEWMDALSVLDAVVARAPQYRDALLGRVVALTRLGRYQEAIAGATHIIDLGEWLLGPAYYWRAFSELQLRHLDEAAADRDRAKSLMSNAAVFLLSGLIEWGQMRLPQAEGEFQQSLTLDFGQCDAALYMGAVRNEMRKRPEAIAAFKQAIQCYDLSINVRQKAIDDIRSGAGSDAAKARLIAAQQRAIDEALSQRDEAARDITAIQDRL